MTPPRKKPICHSCGTPMAGHKRPNGSPVCPKPAPLSTAQINVQHLSSPITDDYTEPSPSPALDPEHIWRKTGYYHFQNPNWVEPEGPPSLSYACRPPARGDTPNTWVSTEPADDIPVKHEGFGELAEIREEEVHIEHDVFVPASHGSSPSISSASTTASALTRRFTQLLGNSRPLASVFSTPRDEVAQLTKTARQYGLFTGIMHRPPTQQPIVVKEEDTLSPGPSRVPRRDSSWWVIFGRDPEVVEHIMEMQDRDVLCRHGASGSMSREGTMGGLVGALPTHSKAPSRPLFVDFMMAGLFGGVALFVLLSLV